MIIALDYDNTYTVDPHLWNIFINTAIERGHSVICVTMRLPSEPIIVADGKIRVYYTSRKAKLIWTKKNKIDVDIWIDDKPGWLFDDAPSAKQCNNDLTGT